MPVNFTGKLVIGISSRALFDLDESHEIFEKEGLEAYAHYQRTHEEEVLKPGHAFGLVQKFLRLNEGRKSDDNLVEVLLLSRNTADTGLRVFNSIQHYGLNVSRAAFAGGQNPYCYAKAFGAHLFLSLNPEDVHHALQAGLAAAHIWSGQQTNTDPDALNFAFDGDAVLFSDEAEKVFQGEGIESFNKKEAIAAKNPLPPGPFKGFLQALQTLQSNPNLPIQVKTALVTARSAPAHARVIHTLRAWDIRIDQALFLGGLNKAEFLAGFKADIFFDDQTRHCESAQQHVTTAHVPFGVTNTF